MNLDTIKWTPEARVAKYDAASVDEVARRLEVHRPTGGQLAYWSDPYEVLTLPGNALTTAGLNRATALLIGGSSGTLDSTRVRLGVGDNATAFNASDAALSTGSNQYFRVMEATYPQQSNGVMTFQSSFATGEANFAWACWGLDVGTATVTSSATPAAVLFNRKVGSLGTKASGTWVLTVTVTFS